ncbi:MAG: ubiquinol-cytochrome c reductase iron-sulfur subunit [Actinomycetota bacterium]
MTDHIVPTRRHLLAAAALGAVGAPLLAACGDTSEPAPTAEDATAGDAIASLEELPDGGAAVVMTATGSPVVLLRNGDTVTALSGVCTHQGCTVRSEGENLLCPCHGSKFGLDGVPFEGPAQDPLPPIDVTVEDGDIVVA